MRKPHPTNTCMSCCDLFMHLTFGGEAGCLWTRRIGAEVCPPRRTPSWETRSHSLFGWWGCAYSVVPPGLRWEREGRAKARDRSAMEKVKSKLFHYIDTISTQRGQDALLWVWKSGQKEEDPIKAYICPPGTDASLHSKQHERGRNLFVLFSPAASQLCFHVPTYWCCAGIKYFLHYVWMWVSSCVGSFECGYF